MLINTDGERQAAVINSQHLLEEPFGCGHVAFRTKPALDWLTLLIQGAVEILPPSADFAVSPANAGPSPCQSKVRTHSLVDLRSLSLEPTKGIATIPAQASENDCRRIVPPFKGR